MAAVIITAAGEEVRRRKPVNLRHVRQCGDDGRSVQSYTFPRESTDWIVQV